MENVETIINSILLIAIRAPSGDNSQPWSIEKKNYDLVEISQKPSVDHKIFNVNGYGSTIAQGALVENICLLSEEKGLLNEISFNGSVVSIKFIEKKVINSKGIKWSDLISKRTTLRIPYKTDFINSQDKIDIFNKKPNGLDLFIIEDKNLIKRLSVIASITEKIVLNNKILHSMFFSVIDFSNKKDIGIQVKSMGLPKPAQFIFKLISNPKFNQLFKKIKFQNMIASQNSIMYSKSGAILVYSAKNESSGLYFDFGRHLEHTWLLLTKANVALHPITGIIYMYKYINSQFFDKMVFTDEELEEIRNAYSEIQKIVGTNDSLVFMSRIGYIDEKRFTPLTNRRNLNI